MSNTNGLVLLYTGNEVMVERIKAELEIRGISSIIRNGFKEGLAAGFVGGVPSAIKIFVAESELEKAVEITEAVIN